ncbi:thioesterase [Pontiellaceae bacterium B12219]|nr:thioesterase [Pontiellaceae bacterium B12219]
MTLPIQSEWHAEHVIRSYDVDPQSTARLPVFCRFMQEAAYLHAEHFGLGHSHLISLNQAWVLARMRIEVERLPQWGETINLRTWPSGRDRLFYYRDFEIKDGDDKILLRASTAWFIIDIKKRERTIPDWWNTNALPVGPKIFDSKISRLKSCGCSEGDPLHVNYGDLDLNGHVSNIRYVEWILNSLPLEFHQQHNIQTLEVNYLAEAVCGHEILLCEKQNGLVVDHSILAEGKDLFRARTAWKKL